MRYIGSKRKLGAGILPFINKGLEIFPNGKYIEPFVGGCNMITQVEHHTRIGYDLNKHLIALFRQAQTDPVKIRDARYISRRIFNQVKANMNIFEDWFVGAIGFFSTYCNKWMSSYYSQTNLYNGTMESLLKQDLKKIHLFHCDYRNIPIGKGNVIYCDPPYGHCNFYKMRFKHLEFCEWVRRASRDNIVFVSEYEMPADFQCIWQKTITPGINSKSYKRVEKLFVYKG